MPNTIKVYYKIKLYSQIFFVFSILFFLNGCEEFGALPKGIDFEKTKQSSNFDAEKMKFVNRNKGVFEIMKKESGFWKNPRANLKNNFFFNTNQTEPTTKLPEKNFLDTNFKKSDKNIKFVWFGHSSILVSINDKTVLIDPVFSDSASPVDWIVPRYQAPALNLDQLPKIDFILISHDHYDHLDMETIKYFKEKNVSFLVPLGVSSHLKKWGIQEKNIFELDWWEEINIGNLKFICTPAQHYSGRMGFFKSQKSLWSSWIVESEFKNFYYSGDSGYDVHYRQIGEKFGPFDLVFMDSGQYNKRWRAMHNFPREAVDAFKDLNGKYLLPVGWGMFTMAMHNWYDPPEQVFKFAKREDIMLLTPILGQIIDLENIPPNIQWWKN